MRAVLIFAMALAAGAGGALLSSVTNDGDCEARPDLLTTVSAELDLNEAQTRRLARSQRVYRERRSKLEERIRLSNVELARAIDTEKAFGPGVRQATRRSQLIIAELQEMTVQELLDTRAMLTPAQAARFDAMVREALTAGR